MTSVDGTLTSIQNNTKAVQYASGQSNLGTGKIDRQGFLQLLMAQIQYQDPTAPSDATTQLTQQIQLEQVDAMQDIVKSNTYSTAASLVGKTVSVPAAPWDFSKNMSATAPTDASGNATTVSGTITSVKFDTNHGKALIELSGNPGVYYDSSIIQSVANGPVASAPTP